MRRILLLLAAAMIVSAPIAATVSTDTLAEAKEKKAAKDTKAAKGKETATPAGRSSDYDPSKDPFRWRPSDQTGGKKEAGKKEAAKKEAGKKKEPGKSASKGSAPSRGGTGSAYD
jgi:hypothetical protein